MNSKLVGVSFGERQRNILTLNVEKGMPLYWKRELDNAFDPNAIIVYADAAMTVELGHLSREMARKTVEHLADGGAIEITASAKTGGPSPRSYGVNIVIHATKGGVE